VASQGNDRLKAILAQARARAAAAESAGPPAPPPGETHRVEALLDKGEALPDPRALARLYKDKTLVARLPEDEDAAAAGQQGAPPGSGGSIAVEDRADPVPSRPPLNPTQIREVMNELKEQFESKAYVTFEAKPNPIDVIPMAEEPDAEEGPEPLAETHEGFYILGGILAILVVGLFVLLTVSGPLRYRAPAGAPSPSASASAGR
jgi:hypothetical protein